MTNYRISALGRPFKIIKAIPLILQRKKLKWLLRYEKIRVVGKIQTQFSNKHLRQGPNCYLLHALAQILDNIRFHLNKLNATIF